MDVIKSLLIAFGLGCAGEAVVFFSHSTLVMQFLKGNIVTLQIGLLAINTATLGIVLTKVRELVSKGASADAFAKTRAQMLLSIREQVGLLAAALLVLTLGSSPDVSKAVPAFVPDALLLTCFIYSIMILYDTAVSVFVILDAPR
jgi:hypothetical protein